MLLNSALGTRHSAFRFRRRQSGYVLMVLLFMMAVLMFAAAAAVPAMKQQIQRDREEEMIHRGAQYSRAIKRFFKKFGRYPTSLDQLENTNNLRFLRKRYQDPMTPDGKWNLLHVGDVKLGNAASVGTPVSALSSGAGAQPGSAFGGGFGQSGQTQAGAAGQILGGQSASAAGQILGGQAAGGAAPGTTSTSGASAFGGTSGVVGGAIIGVASANEREGLHVFNDKTHYNQWYFVYDPTIDRGGLINGPYTGKVFNFAGAGGGLIPGAQPAGQSTFGQPASGFGQPMGGQSGGIGQPSSFGQPQPPQPKPPQPPQQ